VARALEDVSHLMPDICSYNYDTGRRQYPERNIMKIKGYLNKHWKEHVFEDITGMINIPYLYKNKEMFKKNTLFKDEPVKVRITIEEI